MTKFAQGLFTPKHPEKYIGKKKIHYRSSWEWAFMNFADNNPSVLQWASESINIPYRNPFTGKNTIYVPDFFIVYVDKNQKQHAELIEVKPKKETSLEEAGRSKKAQAAAILNQAKWEAAAIWCKRNQIRFRIVTEDDIFHQGTQRRRKK
jgi:hypothetical protein